MGNNKFLVINKCYIRSEKKVLKNMMLKTMFSLGLLGVASATKSKEPVSSCRAIHEGLEPVRGRTFPVKNTVHERKFKGWQSLEDARKNADACAASCKRCSKKIIAEKGAAIPVRKPQEE